MGSSESRSARPLASPQGRHPTTGEGGHSHAPGSLLKLVGGLHRAPLRRHGSTGKVGEPRWRTSTWLRAARLTRRRDRHGCTARAVGRMDRRSRGPPRGKATRLLQIEAPRAI